MFIGHPPRTLGSVDSRPRAVPHRVQAHTPVIGVGSGTDSIPGGAEPVVQAAVRRAAAPAAAPGRGSSPGPATVSRATRTHGRPGYR